MKKYQYNYFLLFCLLLTSCAAVSESTQIPIIETQVSSIPTTAQILTPTPYQIMLPSVTMSPQENEKALVELLKTNGNCTEKCLGGIRPDEMTVQDAVNVMSQWGMVALYKDSQGKTFINLNQNQLYGQLNVYLSVGTWTKEFETIDTVAIRIDGDAATGSHYVKEDVWLANQESFRGFRMDNILKAYGIPSFVGYDFSALLSPNILPKKGERFVYAMSFQYEQINMSILFGGMAYYDGEVVYLCPSKEPHALYININPERPLKELQNVYPVTWQILTGTDLTAFYQSFTGDNAFDVCTTTTMYQILALQP